MKSLLYLGCPPSERVEAERILAAVNLSIVWAEDAAHALTELQRRNMPVLVDLTRGAAALQTARELRDQRAATVMFAVVDSRRPDLTTEAVLAGMADVFWRPLAGRRIASAIERETGDESPQPVRRSDVSCEDLYCHSPAMRDVRMLITGAATVRAGVMIRGEAGTGRRVVARAIHANKQGSQGQFVCVDCAAFDAEHLDAEMFGEAARPAAAAPATHGLVSVSRASRLHDAMGGTLYLQNVADAPMRSQARLARLLRDQEAVLVETGAAVNLDVRPMTGVDFSFETAVQEARVREDLFRRLSVIRIDVPPLRNRREDIPALANYFLREVCTALRLPPKTLSRPALSLISALPWRGNAVELRGVLESVASSAAGRGVGLNDLLAHLRLDAGASLSPGGGTLRQARMRFERDYIAAVLEQHQGRISEAAKVLGIQRTNLYRKIRSLRVSPQE